MNREGAMERILGIVLEELGYSIYDENGGEKMMLVLYKGKKLIDKVEYD
jgi:hypothetical protein